VKPRNFLVIASLMLASAFVAGSALAGPATEVVKTKQTVLFGLIGQPQTPDTQAKLKALFDEMLDYAGLARASLGDRWDSLKPAEQTEFRDLLEQLVRKNYQRNLRKMLGWEIQYLGEDSSGKGVLVKTRAVSKGDKRQEPIQLDFRMAEIGGSWLVVDLVPEGASLVSTYRNQFTRILDKDGYPALKAKMHKKLAEKLESQPAGAKRTAPEK
jgi:phospholipid transport system substrate-binding protein